MVKFDYINDTHIDFWVKYGSNLLETEIKTIDLALHLLESKDSDYLLIGGDLGHYNLQNKWFLDILRTYYKKIYLVFGNHDFYLVSNSQYKTYKGNSLLRLKEMKSIIDNMDNVEYLNGNVIEIEGVKLSGVNMWYDFSFGLNQGKDYDTILNQWYSNSNDSNLIKGLDIDGYYNSERLKLDSVIKNVDIIMSHMGPDYRLHGFNGDRDYLNNFYFFDGKDILDKYNNKVWLFGHIHGRFDINRDDWRMISHAMGYKDQGFDLKVKTFEV